MHFYGFLFCFLFLIKCYSRELLWNIHIYNIELLEFNMILVLICDLWFLTLNIYIYFFFHSYTRLQLLFQEGKKEQVMSMRYTHKLKVCHIYIMRYDIGFNVFYNMHLIFFFSKKFNFICFNHQSLLTTNQLKEK